MSSLRSSMERDSIMYVDWRLEMRVTLGYTPANTQHKYPLTLNLRSEQYQHRLKVDVI